jgi:hypothetical protein
MIDDERTVFIVHVGGTQPSSKANLAFHPAASIVKLQVCNSNRVTLRDTPKNQQHTIQITKHAEAVIQHKEGDFQPKSPAAKATVKPKSSSHVPKRRNQYRL